jgi:hypothetical protein
MMNHAPLASTIVALGLVPVAVFYVHTFVSGFERTWSHRITGLAAVTGDLVLSIGYMLFRTFGGRVEGTVFHPEGAVLAFFVVHGLIASVVVLLEAWTIVSAIRYALTKSMFSHHLWLSKVMFVLWALTFLSGEAVYVLLYVV